MKPHTILTRIITVVACIFFTTANSQTICPIIPMPLEARAQADVFTFNKQTSLLVSDESLRPVAYYLQQQLLQNNQIPISIQSKANTPSIQLSLSKNEKAAAESYSLHMNSREIKITGASNKGVFYGVISLLQLVSQDKRLSETININCWNINDAPRYEWRGFMLDESRHFFGKEKVKSLLDWMAFYKLNRFHWHLTDEPAWRLEIKKYPMLALVGGIGNYTDPFAPAQFYTQQEITEIVGYAAERQITVIPEIDMPGHATAANKAYPQYSGGGSAKHPEFTFHPGKEETYQYLTNILRETSALFPSGMLHLGGDEVSYGNEKWKTDEDVKKLMQEHRLKDVKEAEQYFMQRMADSVFALHAKLLAWDEVAGMNFPKEKTIVFWWQQDLPGQLTLALDKGYNTVLCPRLPLYFDFVQDSTHSPGRKWNKLYNAIENVYAFNPSTLQGVTTKNSQQILGVQANMWTETMSTSQRLDFMLFPRIAALAEVAWTKLSNKNFDNFKSRLQNHFALYEQQGISYYNPFK